MKPILLSGVLSLCLTSFSQSIINYSFENTSAIGSIGTMTAAQVNDTLPNVFGIAGDGFRLTDNWAGPCDSVIAIAGVYAFGTWQDSSIFAMELDQSILPGSDVDVIFFVKNCTTDVEVYVGLSFVNTDFGNQIGQVTVSAPFGWQPYSVSTSTGILLYDYVTFMVRTQGGNNNEVEFDSMQVVITVGQEEFEEKRDGFFPYPNPTTGVFTVVNTTVPIDVLDIYGRHVLTTTQPQIDLSAHARGIYFVRAGEAVHKVVVH